MCPDTALVSCRWSENGWETLLTRAQSRVPRSQVVNLTTSWTMFDMQNENSQEEGVLTALHRNISISFSHSTILDLHSGGPSVYGDPVHHEDDWRAFTTCICHSAHDMQSVVLQALRWSMVASRLVSCFSTDCQILVWI